WSSNWDKEKGQPKFMFDPTRTGRAANRWDDLSSGKVGQGDVYYLSDETKAAFDPNHPWQDGDVLPGRVLRPYEGSEADIRTLGKGEWKDGHWEVTLSRLMDTGDTRHDKAFRDSGLYNLAFAIHRHATGLRWHYVSLPATMGLGRSPADFNAIRFDGDTPVWDQPWHAVTLFYPGQVSWSLLTSNRHPGKPMIERGVPVRSYHKEEQLARYGIEIEFVDEIRKQWLKTLAAGLFLLAGLGFGLVRLQAK
ncbi:MAG TPA: ethylbenzene dehydrogenase-related protein, partial [Candidatus Omnitrophota bacterium]|nr:ethylbenzene dehydrogenase-related protein [Candidatus Omnitrophota bacterium]